MLIALGFDCQLGKLSVQTSADWEGICTQFFTARVRLNLRDSCSQRVETYHGIMREEIICVECREAVEALSYRVEDLRGGIEIQEKCRQDLNQSPPVDCSRLVRLVFVQGNFIREKCM